ncbi:unnamed protein product [Rhizoctonia solani]|uniref:Uncharacterized protein n=1 Tax=Rhizoctonia solani TaxID=456999 RepID=A0A8H3HZI5_9AGAM|nr:unnamed protein product [Rhizoctonia solani]
MISSGDTMAGSLWRARLEYANTPCLKSKQTAPPLFPQLASTFAASGGNNSNEVSELPYLNTDLVETKGIDYTSLSTGDSLGSEVDTEFLMDMLSGDDTGIGHSGHSRPVLYINPVSLMGNPVLSAPSPVDSGYGSRPSTPSVDTCGGYGSDESTWSPVDDTSSISDESSNTHMLPEGFSDAKYWNLVTDAKAFSPAPQGPVIPRIVLSDEEGRVVQAIIVDQFEGVPLPEPSSADEDADSPYGGLMSSVTPENFEPTSPVSCVSPVSNLRHSATGAVLDRAFVSSRPRTTHSAITPVYHGRHRAPTFVLDCVGEEEEQRGEEECVRALFVLEEEQDECAGSEVGVDCARNVSEVPSPLDIEYDVKCLTGEECCAVTDPMDRGNAEPLLIDVQPISSTPTIALEGKSEFNTWHFEDGEDDECEECGLFLTESDDNYQKLFDGLCRLPNEPAVVFGLLKSVARFSAADLNTAYHVTVQRRSFQTSPALCSYDCERGYWSTSGEPSSIIYPQDCPVHGGRHACEVGAIFHRLAPALPSTAQPDCVAPDYETFATEIVGLAPSERKSLEDDLDDSDLILHNGEKFRPAENKSAPPRAGASYDDYMSRFMDDVDVSTNGSSDNSKNAHFGKLVGGSLKDMTVPEAVDHLKEGLEKTESAFRAALTAPFRFNSVADKLTQHLKSGDSKAHPPRERRGSNAFRHHRKESSGIKAKWSNMLNKFTR